MQKKEKIKLVLTIILTFVLLFALTNLLRNTNKAKEIQINDKKTFLAKEFVSVPAEIENKGIFDKLYSETKNLELEYDPFFAKPIIPEKTSPYGLQLIGIVWDEENPIALINDIALKVGDAILGNVIVRITPNKVILNDGLKDFELKLE